ncbi:ABC transporter permease [Pseudonocardia sp. GCM10023141]|uniref:ABC transporter permease n=1 Tax=Pseudonocardia sp. GCM10023141 TaxID=3252653 RepID=UPI003623820F
METVLVFAVLGFGSGAAYAILALGIVLVQRGSGTVNFAQGAIGMVAAFGFADMVESGVSTGVALAVVLVGAALLGVLWHLIVMRALRRAPVLAKVVATLGLLSLLQGVALIRYGTEIRTAPSLLPTDVVRVGEIAFGGDRLWLLGIVVLVAFGLWAWYRFSIFGIATRAAAESERGASLLGYSPGLIAMANWAIGCALGALAGVLISPIVGLSITTLTLMILPGLAAALLGSFTSFAITAVAAIAIGSAQSVVGNYWTLPGAADALPFVVVIVAMVLTGRSIPARGTLSLIRQPLAPRMALGDRTGIVLLICAVVGIVLFDDLANSALTTSFIAMAAALSIVVVTGYVGQTSLMPMTFAGLGGMLTSKIAQGWGLPFPLPIVLAGLCMIPIGALLGLPALRVRGLNLAVVTVGAAVAMTAVLFNNIDLTGGVSGDLVPAPSLFGFSLDATLYPARYAVFCLIVATLLVVLVRNLRRSPAGLRMLAVRSNERAAAVAGIDVAATKLQAFALSAAIAAMAGALLAYQIGAVSYDRFDVFGSIAIITLVYIGGVAVVSGAVLAGIAANGGILYLFLTERFPDYPQYVELISGILLVATVMGHPDGATVAARDAIGWARSKITGRPTVAAPQAGTADATDEPAEMAVSTARK